MTFGEFLPARESVYLNPSAQVQGKPAGPAITQAKLGNGLEIVVIEDHRAPVVTHMVWYRNGSADDPPGKSGIAHFLEHLMFKGTKSHPQGKFSELIADVGGQENAFTSNDYTAYFQRVAKEHLSVCMDYEADRMKNLVLTDEVVSPERDVVLEERRMRTDSDPSEQLGEALQAALFTQHPYGRPIIGWSHEIESSIGPTRLPITIVSIRRKTLFSSSLAMSMRPRSSVWRKNIMAQLPPAAPHQSGFDRASRSPARIVS